MAQHKSKTNDGQSHTYIMTNSFGPMVTANSNNE